MLKQTNIPIEVLVPTFDKDNICFTAVGMIDIPDEGEIQDIINKIQDNPQMYKVGNKENGVAP